MSDSDHQRLRFIDMMGGRLERVASLGERDDDIVLFRSTVASGKAVPLHSHDDIECLYVLSGLIEVYVVGAGDRWLPVAAGNSLVFANGSKHALRNTSDLPADLVLATSNRLARYFSEAGRPVDGRTPPAPPSREDVERVMRVSRTYGYWMASPAESQAVTG